MGVGYDDVAEGLLATVGAVGQDHLNGVLRPRFAEPGTQSFAVEAFCDGLGAESVRGVEVEDPADGRGLGWVGNEFVEVAVDVVAERAGPAGPQSLGGLAFHPGDDAVDDGLALELREHAKHLDQHPTDRGGGVERLGRGAEGHGGVGEFVEQAGQVAQAAGEPVHPVDQQGVEQAGPCSTKRFLEFRAVGAGPGGVIGVNGHDLPVPRLGRDEGAELGFLRFQAEGLVVLVGGAAKVDRDPAAGVIDDLSDTGGCTGSFSHDHHLKIICWWGCRPSVHPWPGSSHVQGLETANPAPGCSACQRFRRRAWRCAASDWCRAGVPATKRRSSWRAR
ncbi:hypothetical protein COUCH_11165 [Couchioplanes caeruleus]|nr:hypothetical protein [Couchioplanes caeruleus]UQU66783.1 hypothetical protein COUCH_11165 [Couchioplanes caeruleus]